MVVNGSSFPIKSLRRVMFTVKGTQSINTKNSALSENPIFSSTPVNMVSKVQYFSLVGQDPSATGL